MELKHVKIFILAAELKNFSKVAEISYISQPSVTKYIQALESELGESLFFRDSRKIELTDFGKAFLPYAKELVEKETETLDALRCFREGQKLSHINIGAENTLYVAPPEVFYLKLMNTIGDFHQRYPDLSFSIEYAEFSELQSRLEQEQIDIALCLSTNYQAVHTQNTKTSRMLLDSCKNYLAVSKDTDLTGGIEGILSRISCYTFEGLPMPQNVNYTFTNQYGINAGTRIYHHWRDLYLAIMLSHGSLATITPSNMRRMAEACGLIMLELKDFDLSSELYGIWKPSCQDELIVEFLKAFKEKFAYRELPMI